MDMYDEKWNAYFYPGTETFINKLNIRNMDELDIVEREITKNKLIELHDNPIQGKFDIKHLRDIHKFLFEDIYPWAGNIRDVYMRKEGTTSYFVSEDKIETYLNDDLSLMKKNIGSIYNLETLSDYITDFFVSLQNIHPFRDGNGRTIKEFLREFVIYISMGEQELDWEMANDDVINRYMPFARSVKGPIKLEIMKTIVPYTSGISIK